MCHSVVVGVIKATIHCSVIGDIKLTGMYIHILQDIDFEVYRFNTVYDMFFKNV